MMSSQFSYELDERQIRIMMQDTEVEGNEVLWNKFEGLATIESKSPAASLIQMLPSFNLSISRSIIVPVLFVALIGGLSAMLFSFVDFKKKESIDKETPLVANPANFKKQEAVIEKIEKTQEKAAVPISREADLKPEPSNTLASNVTSVTPVPEIKAEEKVNAPVENAKPAVVSTTEPKKEIPQKIYPKKKSQKVRSEILPTINATTITNLNDEPNEPELDLK